MFGINRVLDAFWVGMIFGSILVLYFYLSSISEDGGPSRLARWIAAFNARYVMSRVPAAGRDQESNEEPAISPATTTPATSNNGVATPTTSGNELLLGQARALAAMVKAGKIGETEGIKLVFGVSPSSTNPRYQAARAALKAELERLTNHYRELTPEHQVDLQIKQKGALN